MLNPQAFLDELAGWERLDEDQLVAQLEERGWSDGLPVAQPSSARLRQFLAATSVAPEEVLARIPPLRAQATVGTVAGWALLAGCRPEQLPVVIACVRALEAPELNALGVLTTTGNAALLAVVNGPLAASLGFGSGGNCLGPGNRANACAGRALSLVARNVGGAREGLGDMATHGQPAKFGFCFAENESESPWDPLHVERGFGPSESAVTVMGVSGVLEVYNGVSSEPGDLIQTMADVMATPAAVYNQGRDLAGGGHPLAVISPEWAAAFAAAGLAKADVKRELCRRAPQKIAERPEDVLLVVAGGVGIKQTYVPNWSGGSSPVTVRI